MLIPCDAPLGEVVSAYLEAGDFTPSSRATYRRVLSELVRDLGPRRPAASIGADELAAWFDRTRDSYAPATWNRDRVIVRSFVRALQAQGATLELPVIGYRRLQPVRTRALTRAEVARILGLPVPLREKTLWTLAYDSAARASELLSLDVGELDLANRRAVVTSKGGAREWSPGVRAWPGCCRACSRAATRVRYSSHTFRPGWRRPCWTRRWMAPPGSVTDGPRSCSRPRLGPRCISFGTPR